MFDENYSGFEESEERNREELEKFYRDTFGQEYQDVTERSFRRAKSNLKKLNREDPDRDMEEIFDLTDWALSNFFDVKKCWKAAVDRSYRLDRPLQESDQL